MKSLYWMTHDLRLDDNPALLQAAQSEELLLVYVVDPAWFRVNRFGQLSMGNHRWLFVQQALIDLDSALRDLGHRLCIVEGDPGETIAQILHQIPFQRLVTSQQFGSDELDRIERLKRVHPQVRFEIVDTYTLFDRQSLPMPVAEIPETYSRFRRKAEKISIIAPIPPPATLPTMLQLKVDRFPLRAELEFEVCESQFHGGEAAAQRHVKHYFGEDLPLDYKQVRNALDGWENSSKMSAWLNAGCLSTRRMLNQIHDYEESRERNESTYWLYVELLWREYFQWLALKIGKGLFAKDGSSSQAYAGRFDPAGLAEWCEGNTAYPLVNACMRQLNATGYLSNRGRQLAASCLINELQGDWRYGAGWFEQQLIDYDVAANWGNWQYIAGVGADARGGRHFNLAKQTEIYDADGSYRRRWL
ncbi:MAG: DASH family cryptochrome [Pseudomonadales bacterium]|jgi:deoxyribodipyrimidine photo-lyase|nr:DASH family cryptochrome [Pseudomonadales bacterium]MBL6817112.1 DASH family cryptochrome [Pseudomonadales bacterium]